MEAPSSPIELFVRNKEELAELVSEIFLGMGMGIDLSSAGGMDVQLTGSATVTVTFIKEFNVGEFTSRTETDQDKTVVEEFTPKLEVEEKLTKGKTVVKSESGNESALEESETTSISKDATRETKITPRYKTERVSHPNSKEIVKNSGGEKGTVEREYQSSSEV
jgi:hypothetical protein